jgi:hypothetical protein
MSLCAGQQPGLDVTEVGLPPPRRPQSRQFTPKPAPAFKIIEGTQFLVDGFVYKAPCYQHYFLSHFHADHYCGLTKGFDFGYIYCSEITGRCVQLKIGTSAEYIMPMRENVWYRVAGADVLLLPANHCPGAVLFLFRVQGRVHLHTGDFRFCQGMREYPQLKDLRVDGLYLDTTFLNPTYDFPPQQQALSCVERIVKRENSPKTLFLIGTYQIGKEKVIEVVARAAAVRAFVTPEKYELLSCLGRDMSLYTRSSDETNVHVVGLGSLSYSSLQQIKTAHAGVFERIVGISPTGWNNHVGKPAKNSSGDNLSVRRWGQVLVYGVPYSEHCSCSELLEFVSWISPARVIATVSTPLNAKLDAMVAAFKKKQQAAARPAPTIASFFQRASVATARSLQDGVWDLSGEVQEIVATYASTPIADLPVSSSQLVVEMSAELAERALDDEPDFPDDGDELAELRRAKSAPGDFCPSSPAAPPQPALIIPPPPAPVISAVNEGVARVTSPQAPRTPATSRRVEIDLTEETLVQPDLALISQQRWIERAGGFFLSSPPAPRLPLAAVTPDNATPAAATQRTRSAPSGSLKRRKSDSNQLSLSVFFEG